MIKRLDNIGIAVRDVQRAVAFYTEKLGLPGQVRSETGGGVTIGDVSLYIFKTDKANQVGRTPSFGQNPVGIDHLALEVDDIDVAVAELESRGVAFVHPMVGQPGGFRYRGFEDPDGNMVYVIERGR